MQNILSSKHENLWKQFKSPKVYTPPVGSSEILQKFCMVYSLHIRISSIRGINHVEAGITRSRCKHIDTATSFFYLENRTSLTLRKNTWVIKWDSFGIDSTLDPFGQWQTGFQNHTCCMGISPLAGQDPFQQCHVDVPTMPLKSIWQDEIWHAFATAPQKTSPSSYLACNLNYNHR